MLCSHIRSSIYFTVASAEKKKKHYKHNREVVSIKSDIWGYLCYKLSWSWCFPFQPQLLLFWIPVMSKRWSFWSISFVLFFCFVLFFFVCLVGLPLAVSSLTPSFGQSLRGTAWLWQHILGLGICSWFSSRCGLELQRGHLSPGTGGEVLHRLGF